MEATTRLLLALAMVGATTACGVVERFTGPPAGTIVDGSGTVTVDGVPNDPTTAKVEAMRLESPLGVLVVETYDSRIGPCYDLVFPGDRREASCLRGSGIDPAAPVTGRPDESAEGLNGSAWSAGTTEPGIGMFHHGLAHPTVRTVTVEPGDGSTATAFPVVHAPNVDGLAVYVAWSAEGVDRYVLAGYDADGCLLDREPIPFAEEDPGGAGRDCSRTPPEEPHVVEPVSVR